MRAITSVGRCSACASPGVTVHLSRGLLCACTYKSHRAPVQGAAVRVHAQESPCTCPGGCCARPRESPCTCPGGCCARARTRVTVHLSRGLLCACTYRSHRAPVPGAAVRVPGSHRAPVQGAAVRVHAQESPCTCPGGCCARARTGVTVHLSRGLLCASPGVTVHLSRGLLCACTYKSHRTPVPGAAVRVPGSHRAPVPGAAVRVPGSHRAPVPGAAAPVPGAAVREHAQESPCTCPGGCCARARTRVTVHLSRGLLCACTYRSHRAPVPGAAVRVPGSHRAPVPGAAVREHAQESPCTCPGGCCARARTGVTVHLSRGLLCASPGVTVHLSRGLLCASTHKSHRAPVPGAAVRVHVQESPCTCPGGCCARPRESPCTCPGGCCARARTRVTVHLSRGLLCACTYKSHRAPVPGAAVREHAQESPCTCPGGCCARPRESPCTCPGGCCARARTRVTVHLSRGLLCASTHKSHRAPVPGAAVREHAQESPCTCPGGCCARARTRVTVHLSRGLLCASPGVTVHLSRGLLCACTHKSHRAPVPGAAVREHAQESPCTCPGGCCARARTRVTVHLSRGLLCASTHKRAQPLQCKSSW
ncbi:hypothetical protein NDU88_003845 [Pleurodeles waltl]|uniref:Uncharacterized protein n=1 Tax=Pleurodeles waltl TaxID=8319 RepID=A0AAV7UZP4_PLEWA|nr:hypothetical protein NDU88_003845 [Pleurodeles waltl]